MQPQTRFDLNAAIQNWRQELAERPELSPQVRRELETHLCDTIAGLQRRGLNDEESLWLARRRIGQPQQLGEEFVKADPAKIWRERVFWMASGIWIVGLFGFVVLPTEVSWLLLLSFPGLVHFYLLNVSLIFMIHLMVLSAFLMRVPAAKLARFSWLFQNRLRLATVFLISIWVACLQFENLETQFHVQHWSYADWISNAWNDFVYFKFLILGFLILLVWLLPAQKHKAAECV